MMNNIIEQLTTGKCPFTGKTYNCERCNVTPEPHPIPSDTPGFSEIHLQFCITRFAEGKTTRKEMIQIAKGFIAEDGSHPTPEELLTYFQKLYRLGVEVIPMCSCKRFCFKHGCMGGNE